METELIVDNFAGGGGASTGIELATGRPVDIAINHDHDAIAMHLVNHPNTRHYCESVWDVNPREVCGGNPVGLMWLSPDCKHFSRAKGGNAVPPPFAESLVRANLPEMCGKKVETMEELRKAM